MSVATISGSADGAASFYEKKRRVNPVLVRFSRALKSFPLKAVFVFFHSGQ
jgi:hypothetical protein